MNFRVEPGGHLCLFYERDPAEQMPVLLPYVREGLARDEQCIYVADDQTVEHLVSQLENAGIDVEAEKKRGRLKLWTRKEWRPAGPLISESKAAEFQRTIAQAREAGFQGIRFAVEMTWVLGPEISAERIEHWEATINTILPPDFPARIICQYNRSRLSPAVLVAALQTHPLVVLGGEVCANPFYDAPRILAGESHHPASEEQLDWMLERMRSVRAEEEIAARRRADSNTSLLAAIVESSEDAIASKDLDGMITSWNAGAERLFGFSAQEAIGRPITIVIPDDRRDEEPAILEKIRRGERIEHFETIRRRKDGTSVEISLTISPVRDGLGRVVGASKIARDITHRKQLERDLQEANELLARANEELEMRVEERTARLRETIGELEAFSYSISHDMRAPLRSMQGYAQVLLEEKGPMLDAEARSHLRRIASSADLMDRLIQDVLTFSRIARTELQLQPVDLARLVPDLLTSYPQFRNPEADIAIEGELPCVQANEAALTQCLSNLIGNALKFVVPPRRPRVRIRGEVMETRARIYVTDNGIGIPPEAQQRIFGMFQRLSKDYEGTGIGLAIVRKAMERMGGEVGLESAPGQGSTFWLELPRAT